MTRPDMPGLPDGAAWTLRFYGLDGKPEAGVNPPTTFRRKDSAEKYAESCSAPSPVVEPLYTAEQMHQYALTYAATKDKP